MKCLFRDITIFKENSKTLTHQDVVVNGSYISEISDTSLRNESYERIVDGRSRLMIPALYNTHSHLPMSLLKGYGEDMELHDWLENRIFPAEDKLTSEAVYYASLLSIAEMLRNGIISSSDMYSFCEDIARAVDESGFKCNIARGVVSFDPAEDVQSSIRMIESKNLHRRYHNYADKRIKIDMSIHGEYTSHPAMVRAVSEYALENGLGMQIHLSETKSEHESCIVRHGKTPAEYFESLGLFENRTIAAHCVHISDEDIAILARKGVFAAHCPVSNLKLSSGIARVQQMLDNGVKVTIGTDGSASNNRLDILREMEYAALIQKSHTWSPKAMPAANMLAMATSISAMAQGREDCGRLEAGARADITLLDISDVSAYPMYDISAAIMYSLSSRNVCMTMADGRILYENGEYLTIDMDKVRYTITDLSERLYK